MTNTRTNGLLGGMCLFATACGGGGGSASVLADVSAAQVRVSMAKPAELAEVRVTAHFDMLHGRADQVTLHRGWLVGDDGAYVTALALELPPGPIWLDRMRSSAEVQLVNAAVTNAELTDYCDLQLNLGLTVSGVSDPVKTLSLGFPVKIACQ